MTDPNADLIGFQFECEDGSTGTVTRTVSWSDQYLFVDLDYGEGKGTMRDILKPRAVILQRKTSDSPGGPASP